MPIEVSGISATFLVDTGSDCTIIDSTFAPRFALAPSECVFRADEYGFRAVVNKDSWAS